MRTLYYSFSTIQMTTYTFLKADVKQKAKELRADLKKAGFKGINVRSALSGSMKASLRVWAYDNKVHTQRESLINLLKKLGYKGYLWSLETCATQVHTADICVTHSDYLQSA